MNACHTVMMYRLHRGITTDVRGLVTIVYQPFTQGTKAFSVFAKTGEQQNGRNSFLQNQPVAARGINNKNFFERASGVRRTESCVVGGGS